MYTYHLSDAVLITVSITFLKVANAHRELRGTRAHNIHDGGEHDEEERILLLSRCATILVHRRRRNVMTFSARMTSARCDEEGAKIAGTPNAPSGITPRPHHTPLVTATVATTATTTAMMTATAAFRES